MNVKIDSNFRFSVASIQYTASGELRITINSEVFPSDAHYRYSASLGNWHITERQADGIG